jgi:hypothetical protein
MNTCFPFVKDMFVNETNYQNERTNEPTHIHYFITSAQIQGLHFANGGRIDTLTNQVSAL